MSLLDRDKQDALWHPAEDLSGHAARLSIVAGSAYPGLAEEVSVLCGVQQTARMLGRHPDGEVALLLESSVRDHDVFLVQPTSPPVDANLVELALLIDACRRAGARSVSAIVPYFGYARQDRRVTGREPLSARVAASTLETVGVDRLIVVDLHSAAIEGCFRVPVEHLSAIPLLADRLEPVPEDAVFVAPDLGAARLADRLSRRLRRPTAIVHKHRVGGREVHATELVGEVRGRTPILVDDMCTTGATLEAAIAMVREAGARPEVTVLVTHGLLVEDAVPRLQRAGVRRLIITNTLPFAAAPSELMLEVVGIAPLLAEAVQRLRFGRSLADLR